MPDYSHTILFSAVEGAVKNTLDGHPDWVVPKGFARSVAKRAAGTLAGIAPAPALASARRSGQRRAFANEAASGHPPLNTAMQRAVVELNRRIVVAHKLGDHGRFIDLVTAARILKREMAREANSA